MYQIDINLLNDRPELGTGTVHQGTFVQGGGGESKLPLILGGAVAGGLVGLVLLSLGVLSLFNQQLASREQSLQSNLDKLAPELSKVDELQAKEKTVMDETAALATIFNQIKPWSATLQDLRDRVPPTLRITKIEQASAAAPPAGQATPTPSPSASPSPGAPPPVPPPANDLKLSGSTLNFSDVNDFELTLRKSPFLKPDKTQLVSSQRDAVNAKTGAALVAYEMRTQLSDVPASELLQVLNAKGASGLVSRIEVLKRQGVMKP
jgi:type IV pilus assembly protein PilN